MNTTGYRVTYTVLGVLLLAIIGGSIMFIPGGDPTTLPAGVERYSPQDGDIALNPVRVMIDVESNYEVVLVIDGFTIPRSEIDAIVETGRYQFTPSEGKSIERWTPGEHTVVASWVGGKAGTSTGTLVWTFTVQ